MESADVPENERELARLAAIIDGGHDQPGILVRLDRLETTARLHVVMVDRLERDLPEDHPLIDKGVAMRVVQHVANSDATHRMVSVGAGVFARGTLQMVFGVAQLVLLGWLAIHGLPVAQK